MSDAIPLDHTKPYPWPTRPSGKRRSVNDILPDLHANMAAKPARDKAAREKAALLPPKVAQPIVQAAAATQVFSQQAKPIGEAATKPSTK
jgi:hypothetical protein